MSHLKINLAMRAETVEALRQLARRMRRDVGSLLVELAEEAVRPIIAEREIAEKTAERQREVTVHRLAILLAWRGEIKMRGRKGVSEVSSRFVESQRKRGIMVSERTLQMWDKKVRAGEPLTDGRMGKRVKPSACPFMQRAEKVLGQHRTIAGAWRAVCVWADKAGVKRRSYKVVQRYLSGLRRGVEDKHSDTEKGGREAPRCQSRAS